MKKVRAELENQRKTIDEQARVQNEAIALVKALKSEIRSLKDGKRSASTTQPAPPPPSKKPRKGSQSNQQDKATAKESEKESEKKGSRAHVRSSVVIPPKGKHNHNDISSFSKSKMADLYFPANNPSMYGSQKSREKIDYALPPIKKELLKVIRKKEFCCFDKLKPKKLYLKSMEDKSSIDRVDMKYDNVKGTLKLSKRKTDTVQSFPEWMEVWNIFTQAHLHYHPHDALPLFKYQKYITNFAGRHTFEAVYSYDIDFRHLISAERHLPPNSRQASWGQVNEELEHIHLKDNRRSDPLCYKCDERGHYANKCPRPNNNNNNARGGSSSGNPVPLMSRGVNPPNPRRGFWGQQPPQQPPRMLPPLNNGNNGNGSNGNNNSNNPRGGSNKFCRYFRSDSTCPYGSSCQFRHDCEFCGQTGHNANTCFLHSSTPFRPQG